MNTSKTYQQTERQRARGRDGKYGAMNPCEACGKSTGADYNSNPYTLEAASIGLVLCNRKRCLASIPEDTAEAVAFLQAKRAERRAAEAPAPAPVEAVRPVAEADYRVVATRNRFVVVDKYNRPVPGGRVPFRDEAERVVARYRQMDAEDAAR